jgi:hypothetical protein
LGIINIHTTDRNGQVVGIAYVRDEDELMLITEQGKILRMVTRDVRTIGRATQGVRLIGVEDDDRVVSIARLAVRDEDLNEVRRRLACIGRVIFGVDFPCWSSWRSLCRAARAPSTTR